MTHQFARASLITMSIMASLTIFEDSKLNTAIAHHNTMDNREAVEDATSPGPILPVNVKAPKMIRPLLKKMLTASPTFRRQCEEIGRARHVRISMRLVRHHYNKGYRAVSNVKRYEGGFLEVRIDLLVPNDMVELIGHEFEHVIEQIEEIDLEAQALNRVSKVSRNHEGFFETARAIQAGRRVKMEFYDDEKLTVAIL